MFKMRVSLAGAILTAGQIFLNPVSLCAEPSIVADVFVYGATPAGITSAIAARREGLNVFMAEASDVVGGMMASGLGGSDHCNKKTVGGLARIFFKDVGTHYEEKISWRFEPHVASLVFNDWLNKHDIKPELNTRVESLVIENKNIQKAKLSNGQTITAKIFIDASYEGDLLPLAGVPYVIGRESRNQYAESEAGVHEIIKKHQLPEGISPYRDDGKAHSFVEPKLLPVGSQDKKTMAYNFRLCISTENDNKVPFSKPESYNAEDYEVLAQILLKNRNTKIKDLFEFLHIPGKKYDLNSKGGFSTDYIGANWEYPEASPDRRTEIVNQHKEYTQGLFHFLQNDPRVPGPLRQTANRMGLCKDEFVDSDNWPKKLYVRVARRMKSDFVLNQNHMEQEVEFKDVIAVGSCPIESHSVQRVIIKDQNGQEMLVNEGWASKKLPAYQIPFRTTLPPSSSHENLLVPVALSASHIAYSSLRMEPVFMVLGESVGIAAYLAVKERKPLHKIDLSDFSEKLLDYKQRLSLR